MKKTLLVAGVLSIIFSACQKKQETQSMLDQKVAQFSPTVLKYDESILDDRQKKVVSLLTEAAKVMDEIFLEQVFSKNKEIKTKLENSSNENDKKVLKYFEVMYGPFDRLDHNKAFYGDYKKPAGANYYPEDMTKEEFEKWIDDHPEDRDSFVSEFTVIRRKDDKLVAIPYSEYYKEPLGRATKLLREAAQYADNPTLKRYLETRATAFETNDYFESDMAWMDLKDHSIEVVIGPYEVYEDEMFNYKAAFECFLTIRDPKESEKLKIFGSYLNEMEKHLPIPDEHKNFNRGSESPIVVVQEVLYSGDTKAGIQTIAFNLPNDERVREAKGSKKVMLKSLHEAKFEKQVIPIAKIILNEKEIPNVTFDGFFNHTLMHEMTHGIGPGKIIKDGNKTEVKIELKETYSTIEECKADVLGMYNNLLMIEKGVYPKEFEKEIWPSFLAGIFRSIRFGINEAHGGGNALIFNYLYENGAYTFDEKTEKLNIDYSKIKEVLKSLAGELLMIQANGDYEGSKAIMAKYIVMSDVMTKLVDKLSDIPVDIKPIFQSEQK
ncbi:MAG: peptidase [Calditrichaeota bacterium]|nr:MAG: peptidase [Calditrichota bacterium]MBL1204097.1 peptidase [Calditrichota bacterium]NOG43928.1 peptidase [Calditrichota bacterium]